MEILFAYSCLWAYGFCSAQEYNIHLDAQFSESPDNDMLLELEYCSGNCKNTFARLNRYFEYETDSFSSYIFGRTLFQGLEAAYRAAYRSETFNITDFSKRCDNLWGLLPENIMHDDPFIILSEVYDMLSWGGENESRSLYEEAFDFYKKKHGGIKCLK